MRRWLIILLLLVYPFQVVLAVADQCCVTTPAGLTHHDAADERSAQGDMTAQPVFLAGDADAALADPHCPACGFGQVSAMPANAAAVPAVARHAAAVASGIFHLASVPRARPERPDWRAPAAS